MKKSKSFIYFFLFTMLFYNYIVNSFILQSNASDSTIINPNNQNRIQAEINKQNSNNSPITFEISAMEKCTNSSSTALCYNIHFNIPQGWHLYSPLYSKTKELNQIQILPTATNTNSITKKYNTSSCQEISLQYPEPKNINIINTFTNEVMGQEYIYDHSTTNNIEVAISALKQNNTGLFTTACTVPLLDIEFVACDGNSCILEKYSDIKLPTHESHSNYHSKENGLGTLFLMFTLALVGGFIMNFMPCVLPILSLKLLHISQYISKTSNPAQQTLKNKSQNLNTEAPQETLPQLKIHALLVTSGILSTFFTLALITILLKTGGETMGWGMHFQEPYFLEILIIIMLLVVLNISERFSISLPSFLMRIIGNLSTKSEYVNSFFSGIILTIFATPCIAPFLATAIAFSLSQSYFLILVIYLFIGCGMSIPYLVLILRPSIITLLPKPGPWMVTMKRIIVAPLILTILWLLYILFAQVPSDEFIVFCILLLLSIMFFLFKNINYRIFFMLFIIVTLAISELIFDFSNQFYQVAPKQEITEDQKFNEESIKLQAMNENRITLVNVSAAWCITCKMNDFIVLESQKMQELTKQYNIQEIKLNYTTKSKKIAHYLAQHQKYGIPFNILYGPCSTNGIILPEILSIQDLIQALEQASCHTSQSNKKQQKEKD